jgi:hypothetical protein
MYAPATTQVEDLRENLRKKLRPPVLGETFRFDVAYSQ